MHKRIPTQWIALLFFLSLTTTWIACSKEQSFEKSNAQVVENGNDDDNNNGGGSEDSTSNNDDDDDTTDNTSDSSAVSDVDFMMQATIINLAQINNGTLANDQGTAQSVRDYGSATAIRFRQAQDDETRRRSPGSHRWPEEHARQDLRYCLYRLPDKGVATLGRYFRGTDQ